MLYTNIVKLPPQVKQVILVKAQFCQYSFVYTKDSCLHGYIGQDSHFFTPLTDIAMLAAVSGLDMASESHPWMSVPSIGTQIGPLEQGGPGDHGPSTFYRAVRASDGGRGCEWRGAGS